MEISDVLMASDQLNVFLVQNDLKPASMIVPKYVLRSKKKRSLFISPNVKRHYPEIDEEKKSFFDLLIETSGLCHCLRAGTERILNSTYWDNSHPEILNEVYEINPTRYISRDEDSLRRLSTAKNHQDRGLALGFPEEDVSAFLHVIDGEKRDGTYLNVSFAKAVHAGIKLPEWLAYLSYVPKDLDFVNGKVSESAKEQGTRYMYFVREKNPRLAQMVEKEFYDINDQKFLPSTWKKREDGSYDCQYNALYKKVV